MSLLTTARALDDQNFRWRVCGAILTKAPSYLATAGNDKNFALFALMNPQTVDASMLAFVAIDSVISAAITVDTTGTVNTTAVTDADILRVVAAQWSKVAAKYPTSPAP